MCRLRVVHGEHEVKMTATNAPSSTRMIRLELAHHPVVASVIACLATLAGLVATRRGPGLDPDSSAYMSSGLNWASGLGLTVFDGSSLTVFPPGVPAIVAVGDLVGIGAGWALRVFNAVSLGLSVYLGYLLLRRHIRSGLLVISATAFLGVSLPLLAVAKMAWSEPGFIVVALAFILILERVSFTRYQGVPGLVAAASLVWLGFLFRYAGLALVPIGAISLVIGRWSRGWRPAIRDASIFTVLSSLVPAAWMARNLAVDGSLMGYRPPSADGLLFTLRQFNSTLGSWVLPEPIPESLTWIAGVVVAVTLGVTVAWVLVKQDVGERSGAQDSIGALVPLAVFVVADSIYLISAQMTTVIDALDNRLMSPLYVPMVVLVAVAIDRALLGATVKRGRRHRSMATLLMMTFLLLQAAAFARDVRASAIAGVGFARRSWQESELVDAVRALPATATIYSNNHFALWATTGREPLLAAATKTAYRSDVEYEVDPRFIEGVECAEPYLVWFDRALDIFYSPEELGAYFDVALVSTHPDGELYRLRSVEQDPNPC